MPEKINAFCKWFRNSWDEVVAYLLTFWCTMLSPFLPVLQTGDKIQMVKDIMIILLYATVALFLTFAQEFIFPEKVEKAKLTNEEKKLAKKNHRIKRFAFAMAFGFAAPTAVHSLLTYFMKLSGLGE